MTMPRKIATVLLVCTLGSISALFAAEKMETAKDAEPVSFYKDIRPLFQAKCHGCHQPAKAKGDYVMTTFSQLLSGGETGDAIVASHPDQSYLVDQIALIDGKAEMPPKDDPFSETEVALIERWIAEGAKDDTPENAIERYSPENPPIYVKPPVITSVDYSPDGKLLAVAGFHEILLHRADGSGLEARLVGLSERIESVKFSPDGKRLAAVGGLPERMGELQIWDVAKRELDLSVPMGYDTIYGVSWSPDGELIAFGMVDNTVRAVSSRTGKQQLFMGGHNDWVLDTVFNQSGDHLISVGRDMSAKLTEVKTERFIDNITSITPGALTGGMNAVVMHPKEDHILVGGSDGAPQIYRIKRETVRKIGDNANLIRKYPALEGRVWSVAFRPDGKQFVAGSSLNGKGMVGIYKSEYDATISPELKKAMETARRNPNSKESKEQKMIDEWQTQGAEMISSLKLDSSVYALDYSPDGKTIVVAGEDGLLRFIDAATFKIAQEIVPVKITDPESIAQDRANGDVHPAADWEKEKLPEGIASLEISPKQLSIQGAMGYQQLVVTANLENGARADVTRLVAFDVQDPILTFTERGKALPQASGNTTLTVTLGDLSTTAPVEITGFGNPVHPDWIQDVNPVISKMGCNAGTCHGSKDGKDGFKLSLRGYDPLYDVRGFTDDLKSRRVNYASPDDSLMLLKMTGAVPHEGGQLTKEWSTYYQIVREWIANGAELELIAPKVASIELFPKNPVIDRIGSRQQMRVVATFANGMKRDVTSEAFVESGNTEVAEHDDHALISTIRRGEAPILARYEGAYAATTVTVMGDREGFTWAEPPASNRIDELVAAKWKRLKIQPSGLASDTEFIRRIYLDLTGLPPTAEQVKAFEQDKTQRRVKRDQLIDQLIGSPEFVDHWTNKWSDLLQVNSKFLGAQGSREFRDWIRSEVEKNTPYDEFVYKILTATGSNKENPAASYYKILREPTELMENTTHLFLATRFNCNKCHDHPFERWTQDQYYETAAYFAQVDLARDTKNAPKQNIGGTAVEGAKPLYEVVKDLAEGEVVHDRTGEVQPPAFPYEADLAPVSFAEKDQPTRREELAAWITSEDNQYFAMTYANRVWGYLLGTGIIEPLDDVRAGNPPSNPELLSHLTATFLESDFDVRQLIATICKSRTYQLSIETNKWNEDDERNFSHAKAKRLPAEVLYDAVNFVTGNTPSIPGAPGMRAQQLPDAKLDLKSGFLANLGRPARESSCECERSDDLQMSAVMAFLSGSAIADAVGAEDSALTKMVKQQPDDRKLVEAIYYRVLNRAPSSKEIDAALASMNQIDEDHSGLVQDLAQQEAKWVPVRAQREVARLQEINQAQAAIEAYMPEHNKKKAAAEAEQKTRIADSEAKLAELKKGLPAKAAEWEKSLTVDKLWTQWRPLTPEKVTLSDKSEAEILPDGSVRATKHNLRNLDFLLTAKVKDQNITGIMIETVPDETFPGFGAGLNPNGNFVLTEVQARWNTSADAKKQLPIAFADAKADFNQNGFNVKNAINGKLDRGDKAWAISGSNLKAPHRATFSFKEPVAGDPKGATINVGVLCRYSNQDYPLGRFRIYYTTSKDPLTIGLPEKVAEALRILPEQRKPEEAETIATWFREHDEDYLAAYFQVAKEKRPLPGDAQLAKLQGELKRAENPIQEDMALLQLRQDVQYSIEQSANRRLTAAQDLTWALINSPAFLFNH